MPTIDSFSEFLIQTNQIFIFYLWLVIAINVSAMSFLNAPKKFRDHLYIYSMFCDNFLYFSSVVCDVSDHELNLDRVRLFPSCERSSLRK